MLRESTGEPKVLCRAEGGVARAAGGKPGLDRPEMCWRRGRGLQARVWSEQDRNVHCHGKLQEPLVTLTRTFLSSLEGKQLAAGSGMNGR